MNCGTAIPILKIVPTDASSDAGHEGPISLDEFLDSSLLLEDSELEGPISVDEFLDSDLESEDHMKKGHVSSVSSPAATESVKTESSVSDLSSHGNSQRVSDSNKDNAYPAKGDSITEKNVVIDGKNVNVIDLVNDVANVLASVQSMVSKSNAINLQTDEASVKSVASKKNAINLPKDEASVKFVASKKNAINVLNDVASVKSVASTALEAQDDSDSAEDSVSDHNTTQIAGEAVVSEASESSEHSNHRGNASPIVKGRSIQSEVEAQEWTYEDHLSDYNNSYNNNIADSIYDDSDDDSLHTRRIGNTSSGNQEWTYEDHMSGPAGKEYQQGKLDRAQRRLDRHERAEKRRKGRLMWYGVVLLLLELAGASIAVRNYQELGECCGRSIFSENEAVGERWNKAFFWLGILYIPVIILIEIPTLIIAQETLFIFNPMIGYLLAMHMLYSLDVGNAFVIFGLESVAMLGQSTILVKMQRNPESCIHSILNFTLCGMTIYMLVTLTGQGGFCIVNDRIQSVFAESTCNTECISEETCFRCSSENDENFVPQCFIHFPSS